MTHPEKKALKVFLCHASGDKPAVGDLYKRLTVEGVDAWLDQEKLLPGQDWRMEIPRAVRSADVVVICLSKKSITKEGYIQKEIKFALDIAEEKPEGTIFLIPARLEDCAVPERLNRWQWVDLYEDNGFIRLLRSLKLRAAAVGATIEPASYIDSDKERESRLELLYTEGLAAFYTEDWDKACQRFQSILSERPNHRNAAEKLAAAERQRDLAKLYEQATGAVRSEDWKNAVQVLEKLSQKSSDYKDTPHLLRNARKQKQLNELYAEARALHAAQKWEAVIRVFGRISSIESNYPDADGLLPSAQEELVELQRIAELNDQYSHALREMDVGNWHEARRFLETVHKSETGFRETEKLLRKVENEIAREEEKRKQSDQINTLYEQAHGLLRSKKWRNALDKLEEIHKLDDQFPDADGIAEKAQRELAREEQEAERQNKLAALYAEAVKLMKEGKYQEVLDKWHEVKAFDPKYPDRQRVQKTARKKLAESANTLQHKSKFPSIRPVWIGIMSLSAIGLVVVGMVVSNKGGSEKEMASSTSVPSPTIPVSTPTNIVLSSPTVLPQGITNFLIKPKLIESDDFSRRMDGWSMTETGVQWQDGTVQLVGKEPFGTHIWRGDNFTNGMAALFLFEFFPDMYVNFLLEQGTWQSSDYRRYGVNLNNNEARADIYKGQNFLGGIQLTGNLVLQEANSYFILLAIDNPQEFAAILWDSNDPSSHVLFRRGRAPDWPADNWVLMIQVFQGQLNTDAYFLFEFDSYAF